MTPVAHTIHLALRKSLLFRIGYNEGITTLQQWLLLYIMTGRGFDLVDFFICELEDVIMDGMTIHRRHPSLTGSVGFLPSSVRMLIWMS